MRCNQETRPKNLCGRSAKINTHDRESIQWNEAERSPGLEREIDIQTQETSRFSNRHGQRTYPQYMIVKIRSKGSIFKTRKEKH